MYALSLDQPFAHMIVRMKMNVESRRWTTKRRGSIAIHATAKSSQAEFDWVNETFNLNLERSDVEYGCVVGFAEIVDIITEGQVSEATEKWFIGPYGFVLKNIVELPEPVPVKGNRKFWRLKGAALSKSLAQLKPTELKKLKPFE